MTNIFMGIDTSNYTTSVAFTDEKGSVIAEERKLLDVEHGKRGLRQSEAFYQHCFNLPELLKKTEERVDFSRVRAIGVSTRPRNIEGSYMPVFKSGENFAMFTGTVLNVPVFEFSHQEGHVKAITAFNEVGDEFTAFHLSGGTNEILRITKDVNKEQSMDIIIEGRTLDISMGQLIDRIGVALDLPFPAGPYMDRMALDFERKLRENGGKPKLTVKPIPLKGLDINVSGIETQLMRNIESFSKEETAYVLFKRILTCLEKQVLICEEKYPGQKIVFAGGVSRSGFLREHLSDRVIFGMYSSDNAVGISLLAGETYMKK